MTPPPGPRLYRLVKDGKYLEMVTHLKDNPQDVYWQDDYGNTALHVLCQHDISDMNYVVMRHKAVEAILEIAPQLAGQGNHKTFTPLYLACSVQLLGTAFNKNWMGQRATSPRPEVDETLLLLLIDAYPEALNVGVGPQVHSKRFDTPFLQACRGNASRRLLKHMLQADPGMVLAKNCEMNMRPLCLLWEAIERERKIFADRKMVLLINAAYFGMVTEEEEDEIMKDGAPNIFHKVATIDCPIPFVDKFVDRYLERGARFGADKNLLWNTNSHGHLPLHCLCSDDCSKQQKPLPEAYRTHLLDIYLEHFPQAASVAFPESSGRLPLHVWISDLGYSDPKPIESLISAYPDALTIPDPTTGLIPFLASAENAILSDKNLSLTYELLRASPDVLKTALQNHEAGGESSIRPTSPFV